LFPVSKINFKRSLIYDKYEEFREFYRDCKKEWLAKHVDNIYTAILFSSTVFFSQITAKSEVLYFLVS
jgi:hypothetical protein